MYAVLVQRICFTFDDFFTVCVGLHKIRIIKYIKFVPPCLFFNSISFSGLLALKIKARHLSEDVAGSPGAPACFSVAYH